MSKIALVTGGAGFIGSHVVDALISDGYFVRVLDDLSGGREENLAHLSNSNALTTDWRDIRSISPSDSIFQDVHTVYHFAGKGDIVPSIEQPSDYMDINVQGTVRVLEGARTANVKRIVYAASSSCYGLAETPTSLNHPIRPEYPYALSKYMGEQAVLHWHKVYGLSANVIRIFNAYGTRVKTTGAYGAVFGVFFKQKLANKPFTIVGDGTQSRDFVYVTDVARAFKMAGETDHSGKIWNLGAGNPQSILHLANLIGGDIEFIPKRPGEPDCTWADISPIQNDLSWQPQISFEDGVNEMMAEIHKWEDAPLWDRQSIEQATQTWFKYMDKDEVQ